ncbi:MAG: glycosyltransferase [bacterium]|nr:glycosyltransferase [bacterium]
MRIALCYDRINKFGGAERVLQALHEIWPDAPVYTLTYDHESASWARDWDIRSSFLQKIPFIGKKHELFPAIAPLAWEQFNFNQYDVVISITSSEAKGILTSPRTRHICYCLTPTRYLWSGYFDYLESSGFGIFHNAIRGIFSLLSYPLRSWDYYFAQRPDEMIGISDEVCSRIKKYYRRESRKIYPPVDIPALSDEDLTPSTPFFLVISRLVPYKRIDLVVEAFNRLGWPLKVIGTGSELAKLRVRGGENIEFLGFLSDSETQVYYRKCLAVIFPSFEDFGIVPVEAQSYGKPVIAYRGGGVLETVIEGETGLFFDKQTPEALVKLFAACCSECIDNGLTIDNMIQYLIRFKPEQCIRNAARFSREKFKEEFISLVA